MDIKGEGSYVWKEADVSSYLDTWDKVNGAKIYLRTEDPMVWKKESMYVM